MCCEWPGTLHNKPSKRTKLLSNGSRIVGKRAPASPRSMLGYTETAAHLLTIKSSGHRPTAVRLPRAFSWVGTSSSSDAKANPIAGQLHRSINTSPRLCLCICFCVSCGRGDRLLVSSGTPFLVQAQGVCLPNGLTAPLTCCQNFPASRNGKLGQRRSLNMQPNYTAMNLEGIIANGEECAATGKMLQCAFWS